MVCSFFPLNNKLKLTITVERVNVRIANASNNKSNSSYQLILSQFCLNILNVLLPHRWDQWPHIHLKQISQLELAMKIKFTEINDFNQFAHHGTHTSYFSHTVNVYILCCMQFISIYSIGRLNCIDATIQCVLYFIISHHKSYFESIESKSL